MARGSWTLRVPAVVGLVLVASAAAGAASRASLSAAPVPRAGFTLRPDAAQPAAGFEAVSHGFAARVSTWRWTFGDGSAVTTKQPSTAHSYAAYGPYQVSLTESDGKGTEASATGSLVLVDCKGSDPCAASVARGSVDAVKASGPTADEPSSLAILVAPYRIATCEASIGPDAALIDSGFTGNLQLAIEYHVAAGSPYKSTCFQSTVKFIDSGGHSATSGLLPSCTVKAPVAPCVESVSTSGTGATFTVTKVLLVPPGDPTVGAH